MYICGMSRELKKTYTFKLKPSVRKKLDELASDKGRSASGMLEVLIVKTYE